jgi:hypothetical protein
MMIQNMIPMKKAAYVLSKVDGHWLTKAISIEEPSLTAFPINPV